MLQDFVLRLAQTRHVWSESDCAMTIANWWWCKHGFDPAADLRGTYSTEEECLAVVKREGGMIPVVGFRARRAGARPTLFPVSGDIGVISVDGFEFGAILGLSGRWIVKSARGVASFRCDPLIAWRT